MDAGMDNWQPGYSYGYGPLPAVTVPSHGNRVRGPDGQYEPSRHRDQAAQYPGDQADKAALIVLCVIVAGLLAVAGYAIAAAL
jgi:hypothetical protein